MQSFLTQFQTILSMHLIMFRSNATFSTTNNIVNAFDDNDIKCRIIFDIIEQTISSKHLTILVWIQQFRHRQSINAFDHFTVKCSTSDIKQKLSMHLMTLASNAVISDKISNNFVRAFDHISIKCNAFDNKQNCQCIW